MMRIIFLGSPEFAVPGLKALVDAGHDVALVVTRPDKPRGRGLKVSPSAVKKEAMNLGLQVQEPNRVNDEEFIETMRKLQADLGVVVAFGRILSATFLQVTRLGFVNVHASLLPKYRGAAPIQYALMNGETETGITIQFVAEKLDSGDMIYQESVTIEPDDTLANLEHRLAPIGARLLVDAVGAIESGTAPRIPQDEAQASYAPSIKPEDAIIDWTISAREIVNRIRAFNPRPGATAQFRGNPLRIWWAKPATSDSKVLHNQPPGGVITMESDGPVIKTGDGFVQILEIQPASRRSMSGRDFANGMRLTTKDRFE